MRSPLARFILPLMFAGLLVAGCDSANVADSHVTAMAESANAHQPNHRPGQRPGQQQDNLLTNIPVTQTLNGSVFEGLLSITSLAFVDGQLLASGTITGEVTGALEGIVNTTFENVAATLTGGGQRTCRILTLDLGPLDLNLLGLQVDLAPIQLDITAQRGPGNLLGNLLCAVAGLLDGGGLLSGIENLLNQINNLLG